MGVVITGPIKRAVIAGSYTPLYTARVVACSRSEFRSGISDEPVREQVSPLAVVPHSPFIQKEFTPTNSHSNPRALAGADTLMGLTRPCPGESWEAIAH